MRLMREVRFSVGPDAGGPITNSWGGWPTATGIQPYLVLRTRVEGEPHSGTGYLCNIALIDRLVRERTIPLVRTLVTRPSLTGEMLIRAIADALRPHALAGTDWVDWQLFVTPFLSYTLTSGAPAMVNVTQCFEFSAAHRLHCDSMSDDENRRTFGKYNNPNGHGHNYQFEVTITGDPDASNGVVLPIAKLEQIVHEHVIERLDHRHLNQDCPEFATLNPSVENIARVIWGMLAGQLAPATLKRVRVWETPKTCADYEGQPELSG